MMKVLKKHSGNRARLTKMITPHGEVLTPAFMPVGTRAFVNCMTPASLRETNSQIILGGNTYHMLCSPGLERLEKLGGMHRLMSWAGPMLTDSGGYQVFSLAKDNKHCKIDDKGATFRVPDSAKTIRMTPAVSIEAQKVIGADIIMAFDQCTPDTDDRSVVMAAMERTHRWLKESLDAHLTNPNSAYGDKQQLFGIIQGGFERDLREQSAEFVTSLGFDGIAIGGESIGYDMEKTAQILDWLAPFLPEDKTRYAMGVGLDPQNLIDVVEKGVDIFDCVAPTRNARHGALYCGDIIKENGWVRFASDNNVNRILIKRAEYAEDENPIMSSCDCNTCTHYTRAYLHFLFRQKSLLYYPLATAHNVRVMQRVCEVMRECISEQAIEGNEK